MKNYLIIQKEDQEMGQIAISMSVINDIITNAVMLDENVHFDEIRGIKTPADVELGDNGLVIDLKVRVQYGQDVEASCANLQEEIRKQLELMVDYHNPVINFSVVGFKFD